MKWQQLKNDELKVYTRDERPKNYDALACLPPQFTDDDVDEKVASGVKCKRACEYSHLLRQIYKLSSIS